ncbi:MAG: hypothetical protein ABI780_02615 [Ardenticatenales bacterium]
MAKKKAAIEAEAKANAAHERDRELLKEYTLKESSSVEARVYQILLGKRASTFEEVTDIDKARKAFGEANPEVEYWMQRMSRALAFAIGRLSQLTKPDFKLVNHPREIDEFLLALSKLGSNGPGPDEVLSHKMDD